MRLPFGDGLRMALQTPVRKPGRTALTALGLAIGVGTFIAMVSFGRGARSSVVSQFESLGSNLLRVKTYYGVTETPPLPIDDADIAALRREATAIEVIVPFAYKNVDVTYGSRSYRTGVYGTTPEFVRTREMSFDAGGSFVARDLSRRSKLCVIGATTAAELFGSEEPLGKVITIDGQLPCSVVGLLGARGTNITGGDMDDRVIVPLTTFAAYLGAPVGYMLEVRPKSRALLEAASAEIVQILRRTHRIGPRDVDDFHIISPDQITNVASQISGTLTGLLAVIAAVSLLVGGIGIMNIQLVSVAERTHEIGVRSAVGAAPERIMGQFLTEAVVISLLGSLAGVALGIGISLTVAGRLGWPRAGLVDVAIGSALFGTVVGTLFGYLPAVRAARLDPIEALRRK